MILTQKFTLARIAEVVGKNPATLRTHINRGLVTAQGPRNVHGDKPAGKHSRFSFYTLMEFALAYHLYDNIGLQLDTSFEYARDFAHVSGGGDIFNLPYRELSLPFHHRHGETVCGFAHDRSFSIPLDSEGAKSLYITMRHHLQTDDFILVNASQVFSRVCTSLGLHPYKVLDDAYPEASKIVSSMSAEV